MAGAQENKGKKPEELRDKAREIDARLSSIGKSLEKLDQNLNIYRDKKQKRVWEF